MRRILPQTWPPRVLRVDVGCPDDESFWQPVRGCWTVSPRGTSTAPVSWGSGEFTMDVGSPRAGAEPVTTIAWRLAHLVVGLAETTGTHFGGPPATPATFDDAGHAA